MITAQQGRNEEALALLTKAIVAKPDNPFAHNNAGTVLLALGRFDEAVAAFQNALNIRFDYAEAHNNLGIALYEQGNIEESIAGYRRALEHRPNYPEAHTNLGNALYKQGHLDEAIAAHTASLRIRPQHAQTYCNLGIALYEHGELDKAQIALATALESQPEYAEAQGVRFTVKRYLCLWDDYDDTFAWTRKHLLAQPDHKIDPFYCLSLPLTASEQHQYTRKWAQAKFAPVYQQRDRLRFSFVPGSREGLRIGYLSADFREHAVSHLIVEVLEKHDRSRFEIFAYSYGPDDNSPLRDRVAAACDHFVDISSLSHDSAARRIYNDKIDVLVDLQGYTKLSRPQISALKPAPMLVNFLGYPGTCGAKWVDYLIADPFITPPQSSDHYAERLVLLPDCYQPNDRQRVIGSTPTRAACGLPASGFVFCNFNQSYKITPAMFHVWMRLLLAVPGSVLWLLESNRWMRDNLRREAESRGVGAERLIFAPKLPLEDHLGRLRQADLGVDTFPYTSHSTASDTLWAGVPLVTLTGETFASRVAGSLLRAVNLTELITCTLADYFNLILTLARTPEKLAVIRADLEANRLRTPLFDSDRYTAHLESAYEMMWHNYLSGSAARILAVEPRS